MKIGVLGSGVVGQAIGAKLVALGHEVVMGTREPAKPLAARDAAAAGAAQPVRPVARRGRP